MDKHPLLTSLESDSAVFHSVAATALGKGDAPVLCCAGWTVSSLVQHLGSIHSLVAEWVTTGRRPDTWDSVPSGDSLDWLARCSARLLDAVATVDPLTPCSTWSPYDQSIGFWVRRMAHETAVHRVDLQQSLGIDWEVPPIVAVDGIDEVLTLWLGGRMPTGLTGSGRATRLTAYGPEDEVLVDQLVRPYGDLVHFCPYEQGMAVDATVSGPADALWAWCWGRSDADHPVEIIGDASELRAILAAAEQ
ncbi:maleylpyruvate isomerase family mycothiol-dependent enzyme [Acidothermaceae bacterium B102]|nr:maleylpyruvate isomerase family mycothiol-dependent enzyme [Acidothermaceae bacterium B102]